MGKSQAFQCQFCGHLCGSGAAHKRHEQMRCPQRPTEQKNQWIQRAKALLFDCTFCCDSDQIKKEINELIQEGGGYDYKDESSVTPLKWKTSAAEEESDAN